MRRLVVASGLVGMALLMIGLLLIVSGVTGWLSGPQMTYAPFPEATHGPWPFTIQPLSGDYYAEDGFSLHSAFFRDCWLNFTVSTNSTINLYIMDYNATREFFSSRVISSAYASYSNVTGMHVVIFRPPSNATYYLLITNNSAKMVARVLVLSGFYVVGPTFQYGSIQDDLVRAQEGLLISIIGLAAASVLVHNGLVWLYASPGIFLRRPKDKSTLLKEARPLASITEVVIVLLMLSAIGVAAGYAGQANQVAPNFYSVVIDFGIRYGLFFILGGALPSGLILVITFFLYGLVENIIVRFSSGYDSEISSILRSKSFLHLLATRKYVTGFAAGVVLAILLSSISPEASGIGLIMLIATVLGFSEYEFLTQLEPKSKEWRSVMITAIRVQLGTLLSGIFAVPILFGILHAILPLTVGTALNVTLTQFVFWRFAGDVGVQLLGAFSPARVQLFIDAMASNGLIYWSLLFAFSGTFYCIGMPFLLGERRIGKSFFSSIVIGLVEFASVEGALFLMGMWEFTLAHFYALAFTVSATMLIESFRKSGETLQDEKRSRDNEFRLQSKMSFLKPSPRYVDMR